MTTRPSLGNLLHLVTLTQPPDSGAGVTGAVPGGEDHAVPPQHPPMPVPIPPWFMITTMCTLSILAVVGNILAIFCFLRFKKKMKQNTIAYLISLAVSDLWIGFMTGCGVLSVVYGRWVLGDFLCQAIAFLNNVALINSLWTVALGSVDRCFAIRVPFKHRSIITKKRLAVLIAGTWCYACALSFPPLLGLEDLKYLFHPAHPWCAMSSRYNVTYFIAFYVGFLPLPIFIILASYIVIFITTRRYTRRQLDRISGTVAVSGPGWRPLSCESTFEMKRQTSTNSPLHQQMSPADPITRLSDEVPLNISSSYDTLKVKQSSWAPQTAVTPAPEEKSFYKEVVQALRALLVWRPGSQGQDQNKGNGGEVGRPRNYSVALCEEEAAARKLRNQAGTLLVVIGATILISYTPLLSIATLAAFHYNVQVTYTEVQGFTLLMLSNASINPLIYFLLNNEFRLAAKSLFCESAIASKLIRRQSSASLSGTGAGRSQTLTTTVDTASHGHVVRATSVSCTDQTTRHNITGTKTEDVAGSKKAGDRYRPASDPVIKRRMGSKGKPRPASGPRITAEEKIERQVLRSSLVVVTPGDNEAKSKSSGLINLSFYEIESAI